MPSLLKAVLPFILLAHGALAAGRDLAPRSAGISPYAQHQPLVAAAGGRYLTVWIESLDAAGWRYLGAFSDAEGHRISPVPFVIATETGNAPAELIGGEFFALFLPHDHAVEMLEIGFDGRVSARHVVPVLNFRYDTAVARAGSEFAAIEHEDAAARVVFFDRGGTITRKVPLPCAPIARELLGVGTDVFVAGVCSGGGGLRLDRVGSDGSVTTTILDPSHADPQVLVAADTSGDRTRVAWASTGPANSLETALVTDAGSISETQTIIHGDGPAYEPLLIRDTTSGFLLPFLQHGQLHIAKSEGGAVSITEAPPLDHGRPARAAMLGAGILVSDIHFATAGSGGRVRTRLVDGNAQIGTTDILSIGPARQSAPAIGAGSGSLLGVWTETTATATSLRATRMSADGTPLGNAVIDPAASLASDDLAWNGSHYLALMLRNGQLRAQRIDAFGARAGSSQFVMNFPTNRTPRVSVVWTEDRWEVAGTDSALAFRAIVRPDGSRPDWIHLPLEGLLPDERMNRSGIFDVALALAGERLFVAWIEGQFYPCPFECIENRPAFLAEIDREAMTVGPAQRISDPYALVESLSLAANDDGLVAVANQHGTRSVAVSLDESLVRRASRTFDGAGDIAWDGASFVLALREREQITLRRVDANLRDAARPRIASLAAPDTAGAMPSVAVAIPGNAIVGVQECDANSGCRAVAYAEQEIELEPQRRRTVRR